jgi:hypothetical protein
MALRLLFLSSNRVLPGSIGCGTGNRVLHSDHLPKESEVGCPATAREVDPVPDNAKKVGLKPGTSTRQDCTQGSQAFFTKRLASTQ